MPHNPHHQQPVATGAHAANDVKARPHTIIEDPAEVGAALAALASGSDVVTLHPADRGATVLAWVHATDPKTRTLDFELRGEVALPPGPILCTASVQSTLLEFTLEGGWTIVEAPPGQFPDSAGQPERRTMLRAPFPARFSIQERRESTRQETPLGQFYQASFVLSHRPLELALYDFSLGGVGLRASPAEAKGLYVGRKLSPVRLELGRNVTITCDLEVRLSRTFRSFLLGEQVQVGCRFSALHPLMEAGLKRALAELEQQRAPR